ncbi:ESCRT-III component [Metarhizium album ARSEF 1941]|uniref:ESCRT-III component n=1 Tax=Metarhizium album (strain ARSEF 1941) TaxID=1081103 RepID=A0A0B2X6T6_METAS|nr:ESCRT-III component [Metarhizium album ARSEF 1941]KHO01180.1 ESCRT-III component [Metarhizium album ARSEF 1941]
MDYVSLPKIELHAHLTGSVSRLTSHEIWKRKKAAGQTDLQDPQVVMPEGKHDYNLQTFFPLFSSFIYNLLTDEESVRYAVNSVLQDFLADGVVYLELRTTPRSSATMSAEGYIATILAAIEEFEASHPRLHTRLILSIDRRHSRQTAESILDLAIRLRDTQGCGVVGIDLCGDPTARPGGDVAVFTPVFERASSAGLAITLHFAEAEASASRDELRTLLSWDPRRLGHVIWEDEEARKLIAERGLCLELCLSCNVQAGMVHGGFEGHHFGHWKDVKGPKISLAILEWAFGKRMTPAERLRKNQRMLDKAIRELDQTRVKLEKQEKTLIQQIKTSAKNGQMGACKIQAKDLVRTRRYIEKFFSMRSQLQKISLRLQLQRIAMEFERENDIMEQRQEMMDDAVDDAMDVGVEEEGDEVVEQVLEEIGIDFNQSLGETPTAIGNPAIAEGKVAQAVGGGSGGDPVDDDLQARLDSLKK